MSQRSHYLLQKFHRHSKQGSHKGCAKLKSPLRGALRFGINQVFIILPVLTHQVSFLAIMLLRNIVGFLPLSGFQGNIVKILIKGQSLVKKGTFVNPLTTYILIHLYLTAGFFGGLAVKNAWLDLWVRKIPKKAWQPTVVFLMGKSHGKRSLVVYSPWS